MLKRILFCGVLYGLSVMSGVGLHGVTAMATPSLPALPPAIEPILLVIPVSDVEAGTLADRVAAFSNLEGVRITGNLNGDDINCIRELACNCLKYLDISGCNIVAGETKFQQGTHETESISSVGGHVVILKPSRDVVNNVIGIGMFASLSTLETIILPNTVTKIEASALRDCPNLKSVTVGSSTSDLSSCCVFSGCSNLTSVTLESDSYYTIRDNTVYTSDLKTVVTALPAAALLSTVDSIAPYAFYDRSDITGITIPQGVKSIGAYAFYHTGISTLNLPRSVVQIYPGAFWKCTNLTAVNFPEDLEVIGKGSFANCNLQEVDLSKTKLTEIAGNNGYRNGNSYWCTEVSAFEGNDNLAKVCLPRTMTSIGRKAFSSANLTDIYCYAVTPPSMYFVHYTPPVESSDDETGVIAKPIAVIGGTSYYNSSSLVNVDTLTCRVHVPKVSLSDYSVAHGWRAFLSNMLTDLPDDIGYEPYIGSGNDLQDYLNSFVDTEDVLTETSYTREFRNTEWQSLYVPFTLNYDDWSPYFEVARLTGISGTTELPQLEATIMTAEDGDLQANYPYLIRAKKTGTYTLEVGASQMVGQEVKTRQYSSGDLGVSVKGHYSSLQGLNHAKRYVMLGGSVRIPSSDSYVLQPYRWSAIALPSHLVIKPILLPINLRISDGIGTTSVEQLLMSADADETIGQRKVYDLSGRRVKTNATMRISELPKGVYLIEGRKCVVK